jgi:hypothetical protein
MGHVHPDTTQQYTDEVKLDELAEALARAAETRDAQASPDLATLQDEVSDELETLRWRRRESNPRDIPSAPTSNSVRVSKGSYTGEVEAKYAVLNQRSSA